MAGSLWLFHRRKGKGHRAWRKTPTTHWERDLYRVRALLERKRFLVYLYRMYFILVILPRLNCTQYRDGAT
jgi:hypothetical protein